MVFSKANSTIGLEHDIAQMAERLTTVRYTSTTQSMLGIHLPKVTLVGNAIPPM